MRQTGACVPIAVALILGMLPAEGRSSAQPITVAISEGDRTYSWPSIVRLADDRLLCVCSERNAGRLRLVQIFSDDHGLTWSRPEALMEGEDEQHYDPAIVVLGPTVLVTSTAVPDSAGSRIVTSRTMAVRSPDNGRTWSAPFEIPMGRRYTSGKVNNGIVLRDGTALFGFTWERNLQTVESLGSESEMDEVSAVMLSFDQGRTWAATQDVVLNVPKLPDRPNAINGVCEPAIVECTDGSLYMLLRTGLDRLYESRSRDGGRSWSEPVPSPLTGHNAPAALCSIRGTRLGVLAVWNNSPEHRWPLCAAVSFDDGRTWSNPREIASVPGYQSSYPGCIQAADGALVAVYQQQRADGVRDILGARFDLDGWGLGEAEPPKVLAHFEEMPKPACLPDGTLVAFFLHGGGPGLPPVPDRQVVEARYSRDGGDTWSDSESLFELPAQEGGFGYFTVLVDRDGEVHLFFLNDAGRGVIRPVLDADGRRQVTPLALQRLDIWHVKSSNGVKAWGTPRPIWTGRAGDPMGATQLARGRLLLPTSFLTPRTWGDRGDGFDAFTYKGQFDVGIVYSDDTGDTWTLAPHALNTPTPSLSAYGAVEPATLELKGGTVWMLVRTQLGRLYESFSPDGITWPVFRPSRFVSSDSPGLPLRLPDGRIVLIWNCCQRFPYAFGGRHVLHAAISYDEGQTWRGYREILRDPRRDEPPPPRGDHGVSYPFATVTHQGKIVFGLWVSTGEGRDLYRLDPDWLEQTRQRDDFEGGLVAWSTFGTRGVEVTPDPDRAGDAVLRVRRTDPDWPAAAVWNFPLGRTGCLKTRMRIEPEFAGAVLGLTDHFSVPFDDQDMLHNLFNVTLDRQGRPAESRPLEPGRWYDLKLSWDCDRRVCQVRLDGQTVCSIRQDRSGEGVCYLRVRSTAESADPPGGLELDFVEVSVSNATVPVSVSDDHADPAGSARQAARGGATKP